MEMIVSALPAQRHLTSLTLWIFVSTPVSKVTKFTNANNALETFLPDYLPGNEEGGDDLYFASEPEESGLESESEDEGIDLESEEEDKGVDLEPGPTLQATNQNNATGALHPDDLEFDGSPLLNPAQQAEVEESQEPDLRLEIEKFGGRAGKPIRVSQPITTECYGMEGSGDVGGTNPYAPFRSQTDWEVAKWGKLRGPTSTAFTELLEIPGVSSWVIWIITMT